MTTIGALRWWYVWFFVGALLLLAAFYLDANVYAWVTQHQAPAAKSFMREVSRWGDWPTHVVLGAAGAAIAYRRRNRQWTTIFIAMVLACAVAGAANRVIKIGMGRSRPSVELDAGWKSFRFRSDYNAFPSGHTAASTAFFAALCFARRRLGLAFLPIPLIIAASRVYLNAHHLSDVVGGAIVGIACALLVWRFVSMRESRIADRN